MVKTYAIKMALPSLRNTYKEPKELAVIGSIQQRNGFKLDFISYALTTHSRIQKINGFFNGMQV